MENLKSVLADKIIDVSAQGGDDLKNRIDKIQRFRDFTLACQTLINKYPPIEDELIRMVHSNDFDTKTASTRVDTIIRLAESMQQQQEASKPVENKEEEKELPLPNTEEDLDIYPEHIIEEFEHEEPEIHCEDVEAEDVDNYEYAEYEEDLPTATPLTDIAEEKTIEEETPPAESPQKEKIRRILQIIGVAIAVVALIFIVKFVINHWETILYILGGAVAIAILIWILVKKNKKQ